MKKLRYLLSAFLLVAGLGTASAQYYAVDESADQSDAGLVYDGAVVAFYSCGNAGGATGGYLNGENALKSELTTDAVYTIVGTGRTAEDSDGQAYPLYLLKQNSTGKYIRQSQLEGYSSGGATTEYKLTDTLELAMGFTIIQNWPVELEGEEGATSRTYSSSAKQDLDDYAWVICSEYVLNGWENENYVKYDSMIYTYLGAVSSPMLSTWKDTNCWWIYPATEATGEDLVYAAFQDLAANCNPADLTAGIDPGCYGQAEIDAYAEVYAEAEAQLNAYTYSDAQAADLVARLQAAKEALDKSFVEFEGGKYYMFASNATYGAGMYLYWNGSAWKFGTPADAATVSTDDAAYYFFVEEKGLNEDEVMLYNIKNYVSQTYITSKYNSNSVIPGGATADLKINANSKGEVVGAFNIIDTNEDAPYAGVFHHQSAGHQLVTWNAPNAKACLFTIKTVPTEAVEALEEALKQVQRNEEMAELVADAKALVSASKVYKPSADCTLDGNLDAMGLVTSIDQLSTNAQEPTEGPLASVLDNNVATFFHTAWSVSYPSERWVDANLVSEVDGISLKLARRTNPAGTAPHGNQGPTPVSFNVYGSNDSITWVSEGVASVDWAYDYTILVTDSTGVALKDSLGNDSVIVLEDFVGVAALKFSEPYKYVRIGCANANTQAGTSAWWYISELRYFAGADYDAAVSPYEQAPANLRTAFEEALATAEAELAAEQSSQAAIDALQAAYDALAPTVPSTAYLHSLIDEYSALMEAATEGEGIGYFEVGSKAVFQTVIDNISGAIEETWTVAQIKEAEETILAAYDVFMAAYQLPEAGKLYAIRAMSRKDDAGSTLHNKVGNIYTARPEGQRGYCYGHNSGAVGDGDYNIANDTIDITTAYNSLWIFDFPVEGSIDTVTIRNAGNGLYVGEGGYMSAEPFKIRITKFTVANQTVVGDNNFLFDVGNTYMNVDYKLDVLVWSDAKDANAAFRIEEVDVSGIMIHTLKNQEPTVLCLPYTISDYQYQGAILQIAGVRTEGENQYMVFEEIVTENGVIVAGTPFVYWPNKEELGESLDVEFELADSITGNTAIIPQYSTESKWAYGLVGTLVNRTVEKGVGQMRDGAIYVEKNNYTIPAYSGVVVLEDYEEVAATAYELLIHGTLVGIEGVEAETAAQSADVYSIDGRYVGKSVKALPAGIYVVGGKKVLVK